MLEADSKLPTIEECRQSDPENLYRCRFQYPLDLTPIAVLIAFVAVLFFFLPCTVRTLNKVLFQKIFSKKRTLYQFCCSGKKLRRFIKEKKKYKKVKGKRQIIKRKSKKILQNHPVKRSMNNRSIYELNFKTESENDIPYSFREIDGDGSIKKVKTFTTTPFKNSSDQLNGSTSKKLMEEEFSMKSLKGGSDKNPKVSNFNDYSKINSKGSGKPGNEYKKLDDSVEMDEDVTFSRNMTYTKKLKIKKTILDEMDEEIEGVKNRIGFTKKKLTVKKR